MEGNVCEGQVSGAWRRWGAPPVSTVVLSPMKGKERKEGLTLQFGVSAKPVGDSLPSEESLLCPVFGCKQHVGSVASAQSSWWIPHSTASAPSQLRFLQQKLWVAHFHCCFSLPLAPHRSTSPHSPGEELPSGSHGSVFMRRNSEEQHTGWTTVAWVAMVDVIGTHLFPSTQSFLKFPCFQLSPQHILVTYTVLWPKLYSSESEDLMSAYGFSSGYVSMWELDCEESWVLKNWCFWTVVLEKTLESPLDCKEIQPSHRKGD